MSEFNDESSSTIISNLQHTSVSNPTTIPMPSPEASTTLSTLMQTRHSTRAFLPKPVSETLLHEALSLAQQTPSNSNLQPWRLKIITGSALQRLSDALTRAVVAGTTPTTEPIPEPYRHYRSAFGHLLYGPEGYDIPRENKSALETARLRNYKFFDAPVGIVVCVHKSLADVDVMCVGMYMQSLSLLLAERGIACCWQVSVAGYPDVVRKELGIGDDMLVLSGGAVGYEDKGARPNGIRSARDTWKDCVEFLE